MPALTRYNSQEQFERHRLKKVVLGEGSSYRSGTSVREFNSFGRCHRVFNVRVGRVLDLFSNGEYRYTELVGFDERIFRIEEQYPILPVSETVTLALELGVKHPMEGRYYLPMRSDHLIHLRTNRGGVARRAMLEVKMARDLEGDEGKRTREKLAIKKLWCKANDVSFHLLLKEDLPMTIVKNIRWMRYGIAGEPRMPRTKRFGSFLSVFKELWAERPNETLMNLVGKCAPRCALDPETTYRFFRWAVWARRLPVDLRERILPCLPIASTELPNCGVVFPW